MTTGSLTESEPLVGSTKPRLCNWEELPEWQKDNHYIETGYVRETNSFKRCFESLGYLHNETVNIYSHLVPGMSFLLLLVVSVVYFFPIEIYESTSVVDLVIIGLFLLGLSACLTLSSIFHCLKSHSLKVSVLGNKLDYLGIVILIVTSMVGIIYYSFVDAKATGLFFITVTLIFGTMCGYVSLKEKFRRPELRGIRAAMFVAFGLSSVFPILYGIAKYGVEQAWLRAGLGYVLLELFFYISGAALYGSRFPERLLPGKFDYFGHSHQIFHVFVVIAACCHGTALLKSYDHAHNNALSL